MKDLLKIFIGVSLTEFLERVEAQNFVCVIKRLSGNDTGLTGGHQSGLYLPRKFYQLAIPEVCTKGYHNPSVAVDECYIASHDIVSRDIKAIYYNSKFFPSLGLKKKYDEFRLTSWGGRKNPLQDPENTGCLFVLGVIKAEGAYKSVGWLSLSEKDDQLIEEWVGYSVDPGQHALKVSHFTVPVEEMIHNLPDSWSTSFPGGGEIFSFVKENIPYKGWKKGVDELLLKRREVEFQLFETIERRILWPQISGSITNMEDFLKIAKSVENRRKSRSGNSLELHLASLFREETILFEEQATTENNKKPDFIFPSGKAYHEPRFPGNLLEMLALKTCCKDRWRQILNEANKIEQKHLFTLQKGISSNQLQEMKDSRVTLVVPAPHIDSFPREWRPSILSLRVFIDTIRSNQLRYPGVFV